MNLHRRTLLMVWERMGTSFPTIRVGGPDDYLEIATDGTLTLYGAATVWDDLRVPVTSVSKGTLNAPGFEQYRTNGAGSTGVYTYLFDKASIEELFFSVQIPHTWREGTAIYPHIHWGPITTGGGNVRWGLEYTWASIGGTFGTTTLDRITVAAGTTAYAHLIGGFTPIDGTGQTHSSMLLCRVWREGNDAVNDTLDADAALFEIDFHYQINSLGDATVPGF